MTRKHSPWPAPDDLRQEGRFACLDFVNSEWTDWRGHGPRTDRLASPQWWRRFLTSWGFNTRGLIVPTGTRLRDLRTLRGVIRQALQKGRLPGAGKLSWLNGRLASSAQRWRLVATGSGVTTRVEPLRADWPAVTAALIISFDQLMSVPDRSRLKKCANPDCSYLFYDDSTNSSRRWCFSNVCGNMMHVRSFRARRIRNA